MEQPPRDSLPLQTIEEMSLDQIVSWVEGDPLKSKKHKRKPKKKSKKPRFYLEAMKLIQERYNSLKGTGIVFIDVYMCLYPNLSCNVSFIEVRSY